MDILNYLEIVQVQRHDFINHLQVVSGLLQLNKTEQAQRYIKQAAQEVTLASKTGQVRIPELSLALLFCLHEAAKYETKVELTIESNFARCGTAGIIIEQAVCRLIDCVLKTEPFPETRDRAIDIVLYEYNKQYFFRMLFHKAGLIDFSSFENRLTDMEIWLESYDIQISKALKDDFIEIVLIFPGKDIENG